MKKLFLLCTLLVFLVSAPSVFAFSIIGDGNWQSWDPTDASWAWEDGSPFWNGDSSDRNSGNIGNYLTSTAGFSSSGAGIGPLDYWGDGTGFVEDIYFDKGDTAYSTAALRLEVAGYSGKNTFGWYSIAESGITLHEIFAGSDSPATSTIFTPSQFYGFYVTTPQHAPSGSTHGYTYFTQSSLNMKYDGTLQDTSYQHFALFKEDPNTYWLGVEDLLGGGDDDYQDMVVKITNAPVPEPSTLALLGLGLLGLGFYGRRRMKK